jgi:hypothetical protein
MKASRFNDVQKASYGNRGRRPPSGGDLPQGGDQPAYTFQLGEKYEALLPGEMRRETLREDENIKQTQAKG